MRYAIVIKHPGRDDPADVRVDLVEAEGEEEHARLWREAERSMLGPFQVIAVTRKVHERKMEEPPKVAPMELAPRTTEERVFWQAAFVASLAAWRSSQCCRPSMSDLVEIRQHADDTAKLAGYDADAALAEMRKRFPL